jgi:hypothetical protein
MRGEGWITILTIALFISILAAWANSRRANQQTTSLLKAREQLSVKESEYDKLAQRMQGLAKLIEQRKIQFPWLASAIADFHGLEAERDAKRFGDEKASRCQSCK